jgi:hypothetical protein
MKEIITLQIEIPVEYDERRKEELLIDLQEHFNSKYNKTSKMSYSTLGSYSWKLPNKNAKIIETL